MPVLECQNIIVKRVLEAISVINDYEISIFKITLSKDINATSTVPNTTGYFETIGFVFLL